MSLIEIFFKDLIPFLLQEKQVNWEHQNVVKQHTDKLAHNGDIGFPTSVKAWLNLIDRHHDNDSLKTILNEMDSKFQNALISASEKWIFSIQTVKCTTDRCILFLDRSKCFQTTIKHYFTDTHQLTEPKENWHRFNVSLMVHANDDSITEYRCALVHKVLLNLLIAAGHQLTNKMAGDNTIRIIVTHSRSDLQKNMDKEKIRPVNEIIESTQNALKIVCGVVKTETKITANEYIQNRTDDMEKMAVLKYGNEKENCILYDYRKLGAGIVTFDLLRTKHTNVIPLKQLIAQSCTAKGAAFILYNVARLQSILNTFNEHVTSGYYEKLPKLDRIDFTLLREEEEWQILYVYIIGFPNVLERCLAHIESGQIAIHLLCTYLSNFSALFSVYYHRVKILTDNQPSLAATMNARIYLLEVIRMIFLKSLTILDIEPLDQM